MAQQAPIAPTQHADADADADENAEPIVIRGPLREYKDPAPASLVSYSH